MKWRFLNTGFHSGQFNMQFDEQLALQTNQDDTIATLRLYGWNPFTISTGFHQPTEDFDLAKLKQHGIDIVRRPTGGRAILHAHELTYSIVMPIQQSAPRVIYQTINEGLLRGLQLLGIEAVLTGSNEHFRTSYQQPASIPCFAVSAKNEIQYHGKKLIGSAQRRYGNVILQHGSFLLGKQHRDIVQYIAPHVEDYRNIIEESLLTQTIEAETILERLVSFDEAAVYIKQGIEEQFEISCFENIQTIDDPILIL